MHQLHGMFDRSITPPLPHVLTVHGASQQCPSNAYWLRVDQLVRPWLFAKISKDTPSEVFDLTHSIYVWQQLE